MKRTSRLLVLAYVALVSSGCLVLSLHPAHDDASITWAAGLVGITLLAAVFIPPDPEDAVSPPWWWGVLEILTVPTTLVGALVGGIVGALALGSGERSLLVWVSQVPAAFLFAGMTSIFQEGSFFINGSVGVLIWAAIGFGIFYLRSQVRSP